MSVAIDFVFFAPHFSDLVLEFPRAETFLFNKNTHIFFFYDTEGLTTVFLYMYGWPIYMLSVVLEIVLRCEKGRAFSNSE